MKRLVQPGGASPGNAENVRRPSSKRFLREQASAHQGIFTDIDFSPQDKRRHGAKDKEVRT